LRKPGKILEVVAGIGLLAALPGSRLPAQPAEPLAVACSAESPVVDQDGSVLLRAFADPVNAEIQFQWTAKLGRIQMKGMEAVWDLKGLPEGRYEATAAVRHPAGRTGPPCSVEIELVEKSAGRGPDGEPRRSRWSFLTPKQPSGPKYGLYTYLLIGSVPKGDFRARCLQAIETYLRVLPRMQRLETDARIPPEKLNVTYLPVTSVPAELETLAKQMPSDWPEKASELVLRNYDFTQAKDLLERFSGNHFEGPYIVSYSAPLGQVASVSDRVLFEDLSRAKPELIAKWVEELLRQAAQERYWEKGGSQRLMLRMATALQVLGQGADLTREALQGRLKWLDLKPGA